MFWCYKPLDIQKDHCCLAITTQEREKPLTNYLMGLFKGAETCKLIGCYLLSRLTKKYAKNTGIYHNDGLSVFTKTPQKIERINKDLCKIFHNSDLKITVESSLTRANFLDVTLAPTSGKHFLYTRGKHTIVCTQIN